jgi:hypothetical protein
MQGWLFGVPIGQVPLLHATAQLSSRSATGAVTALGAHVLARLRARHADDGPIAP